jgi:predicted dehydrogenase
MTVSSLVPSVVEDAAFPAVRTAVVGLGYWGPNLARNVQDHPLAELTAICDRRPDALDLVARRYPSARTTTDLHDVLAADDVEAVLIATPVSTHHAIALAALAAGKHVFVEKPMAASTTQALDLAEHAHRAQRVLMPGHTFLYSPSVTCIRHLLARGELGEVFFISMSRVNLGLHQSDASVTWDLAPHDFSILRYWLDETPRHVTATSRSCIFPGVPDVAFITLEYTSGTISHVELAWLAPSKLRRTTIVGSEKMLVYDDTSTEPVRVFDSGVLLREPQSFGEHNLTYRTGDIVSPRVDTAEPLQLEIGDFCTAIRLGSAPRSSPELGIEVVRMIESVDRSLASAGARVELAPAPVASLAPVAPSAPVRRRVDRSRPVSAPGSGSGRP